MKQTFVIVVLVLIIIFGGIEFIKYSQDSKLTEKNYELLKESKTLNDTNYTTITNKVDSIQWETKYTYKDSTRITEYTHTDTIIKDSLNYIYKLTTPNKISNYKLDLTIPEITKKTLVTEYRYIDKNHLYISVNFSFKQLIDINSKIYSYYPEYSLDLTYQTKYLGYKLGASRINKKTYPLVGISLKLF